MHSAQKKMQKKYTEFCMENLTEKRCLQKLSADGKIPYLIKQY